MTLAKRLLPAVSLILLFLFFASQSAPFRSMDNITNIVGQNAWLLIASMGMTIVILGGGIDLSVGSVMAFCGVVSVHLMVNMKVPVPIAIPTFARASAGGDDHVFGGNRLGALFAGHFDAGRALQHAIAHVDGDLVLLHQVRDALIELLGHPAAALDDGGKVRLDTSRNQPVILGVLHVVEDLGRAQHRLGRDAAPVEADAAEVLAFHDGGLEPELRAADCRNITSGTGTNNGNIKLTHFYFV